MQYIWVSRLSVYKRFIIIDVFVVLVDDHDDDDDGSDDADCENGCVDSHRRGTILLVSFRNASLTYMSKQRQPINLYSCSIPFSICITLFSSVINNRLSGICLIKAYK